MYHKLPNPGKSLLTALCLIAGLAVFVPNQAVGQLFNGVELKVDDQTVPPGGLLQYRAFVTEPKPILKGGQCMSFRSGGFAPTAPLGNVRDGILYSPAGDADGVAVIGPGTIKVAFSSPLTTYGTDIDTPVLAFGIPVSKQASVGQTVPLQLPRSSAQWFDPLGNLYPVKLASGTLTVGGTTSVTDVSPGAGTVQPGTIISIKGVGFQTTSKVDINEGKIATSTYISPNEIQVTLSSSLEIEGKRVRVNTGNERVEYYAYQRIRRVGTSKHALVASSYPMFSHTTWTQAYLKPVLQDSMFSALALQNTDAKTATITLQLYSSTGSLLATRTVSLSTNTRLVRDYAELFPGQVAGTGTTVEVTSTVPIQVLGLLGDDSTLTMTPVDPSATKNAEPPQQHRSNIAVTC
jgi:hypothetical protein